MSNSTTKNGRDSQEWAEAAAKAADAANSAGEMASHAAAAVGLLANQAAREVGKKVDELTASAGIGLQGLGDCLNKKAPETGAFRPASEAVAGAVRESGEYIEKAKLTGMVEDVAQVVRRNPIPSVLIAISLGWFLGRKTKG